MTFATAIPFARRWARSIRVLRVFPTTRRFERDCRAVLAAMLVAAPVAAQEHPEDEEPGRPVQTATLTLEEAINLARQNNPQYRAAANDESVAHWRVRQAYAQFLPEFSVSNYLGYTAEGTSQAFGVFTAADLGLGSTPASYTSRYSLDLNMSLSGATFFRTAEAKANSRAVEAGIGAEQFTLAANVTAAYLAALRARDAIENARSALESAEQLLNLARARLEVGDATRLDVVQAEVVYGQAEVALIQAENLFETEMLELMQQLGVSIDEDVELTSTFEVFEPTWSFEELVATAVESHPQVIAARASEGAAKASARAASMSYLPTITIFGGWDGFIRRQGTNQDHLDDLEATFASRRANCEQENALNARLTSPMPGFEFQDCSAVQPTDGQRADALALNSRFPFEYQANPFSAGVNISLPIFDGFTREVQLQTARVVADDARHQRRAEELNRRTQVATNLLALNAAYRTVAIEERNVEAADEALLLERERYRLGAGTIVDLTTAQEQKVTADQGYLATIYTFHETLAALEAAVGRQLR